MFIFTAPSSARKTRIPTERLKKNLLLIHFALAELANRSDQAVDIGGFAPERDFAPAYPCKVKQIINQLGFEMQVAADDRQVGTDSFRQIGILLHGGKNRKNGRQRRAQLVAQDRKKLIFGGASRLCGAVKF